VKEYYHRYAYAVRHHFDGCRSIRIGDWRRQARDISEEENGKEF
jgi:hypothetical protein